jgi:hypothetical protein
VPRYQHFITITRSFLVPDNKKLYFEPCLGHTIDDNEVTTNRWLEKLRKLYDPLEDPQASRHIESTSRLKDYLPRMLEKLDLDWDAMLSYIVDMVCIYRKLLYILTTPSFMLSPDTENFYRGVQSTPSPPKPQGL